MVRRLCTGIVGCSLAFAGYASGILEISGDCRIDGDRIVSAIVFRQGATLSGSGRITIDSEAGISVAAGVARIENDICFAAGDAQVLCTVGETGFLVQTGAWSGDSPIKCVGAGYAHRGKHRFELRGANTFTGVLTLEAADVWAYGNAAFGSAQGPTEWIAGNKTLQKGSQVVLCGGTFAESFKVTKQDGLTGWWYSFRMLADTQNILTGAVDLSDPHYMRLESGSTAEFTGNINARNTYAPYLEEGAVLKLSEGATLKTVTFSPDGPGTYYFHGARTGSYATTVQYNIKGRLVCMAENRIDASNQNGTRVQDAGTVDLNGFDQKGGRCRGGHAGGVITSPAPATWHVDMATYDAANTNTFTGAVSLEKKGTGTLTLAAVSTSTGVLRVTEGDVTLGAQAKWAGDFHVAGGTLTFEGTYDGASSRLDLDGAAKIVAGSGPVNFMHVYRDGEKLPVGTYSAAGGAAFMSGPGVLNVVAAPLVEETVVWTGEGENDDFATAQNWGAAREDAPLFEGGAVSAVLADAGTRACLSRPVALKALTFKPALDGVARFTVEKTGENAVLNLGGGITLVDETQPGGQYALDVPLNASAACLDIAGAGFLSVTGVVAYGDVQIDKTHLCVCGRFDAQGAMTFKADSKAQLWLSNAVVAVAGDTIYLDGNDQYYPIRALPGTTNRVSGHVYAKGNARPSFAACSETTFAGRSEWGAYAVPYGDPDGSPVRVIFEGALTAFDFNPTYTCTYVFRATGNRFSSGAVNANKWGERIVLKKGVAIRTEIPAAFDYDFQKLSFNGGVLDLAGCPQHFGPLAGTGTVTSASCALLRIHQTVHEAEAPKITGAVTNGVVFAGGVSLEKYGPLPLYCAGVSSTTGTLAVTEGVLGFADGGCWTNCSAVSVSGTGRLELAAPRSFSRFADVFVAAGGTISLAAGLTHHCRYLYVDGVRQRLGAHTAHDHPAVLSGGGRFYALG